MSAIRFSDDEVCAIMQFSKPTLGKVRAILRDKNIIDFKERLREKDIELIKKALVLKESQHFSWSKAIDEVLLENTCNIVHLRQQLEIPDDYKKFCAACHKAGYTNEQIENFEIAFQSIRDFVSKLPNSKYLEKNVDNFRQLIELLVI